MTRRFQVVLTSTFPANNEFDAANDILEKLSGDEIEVNEIVNGKLITLIHRYADVEILQKMCSFGRRPGDVKCEKKAIYQWKGFPYCMAHGYQIAGKKPEPLYAQKEQPEPPETKAEAA